MSDAALFQVVRDLLGRGLTQDEVDRINRAMVRTVEDARPSKKGMGVSKDLIDFLHGMESLRLTAYTDPGSDDGLPITNGWGSTTDLQGRPIKRGAVWTKEYADAKFAQDLAAFETGVNLLLAGAPTTQGQFNALVSFAYNVGLDIDEDTKAEGLGDSSLLRKHKAGDYAGAQRSFADWKYNDGQVMNGLIRRRAGEARIYGGGQ